MRILIAHNRYQQAGGEDAVVNTECNLLRDFGEEVRLYECTNDEIEGYSLAQKISFLWSMGWSKKSYQVIRRILKEFSPQVAHFHNIFFTLSPSVYQACRDENIPIVQSLHNFRLLCVNGLFFRDNHVCEDCLTQKSRWPGVLHGCYKKSRLISTLAVRVLDRHWRQGTWTNAVDYYITATEFGRQKYIAGGIPAEKIIVKPNFLHPDPGARAGKKDYALYVGRLSVEKGADFLVKAWQKLPDVPLKIMGEGPLSNDLKNLTAKNNSRHVEFLGFLNQERYAEYMRGAKFIVVPSICYENFPRIVAEAYAYGIPVLASRLGTMTDLVQDNVTGVLFDPENINDLQAKVKWLASQDGVLQEMGKRARKLYEEKYAAEKNYESLLTIYKQAIKK